MTKLTDNQKRILLATLADEEEPQEDRPERYRGAWMPCGLGAGFYRSCWVLFYGGLVDMVEADCGMAAGRYYSPPRDVEVRRRETCSRVRGIRLTDEGRRVAQALRAEINQ